jgi:non-ribosomal peptide synthetase-like protein
MLSIVLRLASFLYLVIVMALLGVATLPGLAIVAWAWGTDSWLVRALAVGVGYLAFGLSYLVLVLVVKYGTGFRARAGEYAFVSPYVIHWAMVGTLCSVAKIVVLPFLLGQPLLNLFYRLMGARIGKDVVINTCNVFDFELLEIGDGTFIGGDAVVIGHAGEGGKLKLQPVKIGRRCTVGQSSIVFPGSTMGDGAVLGAMSLLPKGRTLEPGSVWGGNPLVELRRAPPPPPVAC